MEQAEQRTERAAICSRPNLRPSRKVLLVLDEPSMSGRRAAPDLVDSSSSNVLAFAWLPATRTRQVSPDRLGAKTSRAFSRTS